MSKFPILWGAGLACALGGAIAGNTVGSAQATDRSASEIFYQSHKTATVGEHGQRLLPDHYPLVTRDGVTDVAQLSDRGLFRQVRYRPSNPAAGYAATTNDGPGFAPQESYASAPQATPETAPEMAQPPAEPLVLAQGPSQVAGQARIIDVQATLAMR